MILGLIDQALDRVLYGYLGKFPVDKAECPPLL